MNIVYASDDNFAPVMGVSMQSLFESNKNDITVYVLDSGISDTNRAMLRSISDAFGQALVFVKADSDIPDYTQSRGSAATFSRLYAAQLLPADVKKAIYLDCDTLITGDLSPLWDTSLDGFMCAGVKDCLSRRNRNLIGFSDSDVYINAGVMLFDAEKWRQKDITREFDSFAQRFGGSVPYADQGILNGGLKGQIKAVSPVFNCYTLFYDFTADEIKILRRPVNFYTDDEIQAAVREPVVIHFTTCFMSLRPWVEGSSHPYTEKWLECKKRTPFADIPLKKDNRSRTKKIGTALYKALPSALSVRLAGLLHSEILPMIKKR